MLRRGRSIRIYVRNKARYNPESKDRDFLYVEIADFAGTTVGDIKEDVRRQCRNSVKIDALYLNNEPLANDRSVAHYNLEDETILETTSNPFWVSCLYIKAAEIQQLRAGHPDDNDIQKWTDKSLPKKYTLIGLLLNSKSEYRSQPPHFPTLDDFVFYLENLKKKGATMHPDYTQKDMRALEREYRTAFMNRYADPLAAFIDHYAVKLGYLDPDDIVQNQGPRQNPEFGGAGAHKRDQMGNGAGQNRAQGRRKEARLCEDCEGSVAEVYCIDCQPGLALCRPCSATLHAGATRRRHTLQDIAQAPKTAKPYVPRAFLAPFSIIVAMYSAMRKGQLSLTEDEIKKSAQSLTDTDLQDKQQGKYVGGFDCMENVLMLKGFVQKEAARVPTYALTATGQMLGEKLFTFYKEFYRFLTACRLPKLSISFRSSVIGNQQLCLLIDENERDKDRLLRYATEKQISAQVRLLPAGDYVWILTPPMVDPHMVYTGRDYANEQVLPFVVERKSWEDLENSIHSARFQRQVNSMLGSGLKNCYYLVEGSGIRNNPTHQQQHQLKAQVEKLTTEHGFYVNYTTCWMKSAQWLLWFTGLAMEKLNMGELQGVKMSYTEYMSRVARHQGAAVVQASFRAAQKLTHKWTAQLFIDHIFRDSLKERSMISTVQEDLGVNDRNKHLLIIENLQEYNKRRQSTLNKCCDLVYANPGQAREIVSDKIGAVLHNMVHYDIPSYWQLYIQVLLGVYVVRTECEQDRDRIQQKFVAGPQDPHPPITIKTPGRSRQPRKKAAHRPAVELQSDTARPLQALDKSDQFRKKTVIHTIDSFKETSLDREMEQSGRETHVSNDRLTKVLATGRKEEPDLGRTGRQVIVPFAGQGVCLGSREQVNTGDELVENMRDREIFDTVKGVGLVGGVRDQIVTPLAYGMRDREKHQAIHSGMRDRVMTQSARGIGLIGGMRDTVNDAGIGDVREDFTDDTRGPLTDSLPDAVPLDAADFIDSQNEEDILNEVLNRSARDVQKPSKEEELMQLALKLSKTETTVHKLDSNREEEMVKLAIEMSKREFTPVKIDQNIQKGSRNVPEAQMKQALNMNVSAIEYADTADEHRPKRAVKRKLVSEENNNVNNSSVEVKKEVVETLTDEEDDLRKAIELSKGPVDVNDSNEEDEIRCAIAKSIVEHSPVKKSKQSYDEELRLALARSIVQQNTPTKSQQRVIDKLSHGGTEKIVHLPINEINESMKLKGINNIDQPLSKIMRTWSETASHQNEDQIVVTSKSQHLQSDNAGLPDSVTSFVSNIARETSPKKEFNSNKINLHSNDSAKDIAEQNESDSEDDLVPPSPQKCSQSFQNKSFGDLEQLRTATGKPGAKDEKKYENKYLAGLGKVKPEYGKKSGFDIKSSLFETSDNSDSDADDESGEDPQDESKEDIFEDPQDNEAAVMNGKVGQEKDKNRNANKPSKFHNVKVEEKADITDCIEGFSDAGYGEDDDLDIDYQPNTQEIQEATEDSDDVCGGNSDISVEDDVLPVIRQPRSKRYKELKARCEHLLKQKNSKQGLHNVDRDNEENYLDQESDSVENSVAYERDRTLANMLQECFDKQNKQETKKRALIDDEYIAKRLQEEYNRKAKTKVPEEVSIGGVGRDVDDILTEKDEEYARKLQDELNKDVVETEQRREHHEITDMRDEEYARKLQDEINKDVAETVQRPEHSVENAKHHELNDMLGTFEEGSKELVRELQRRELQKIENLKKAIDRDKKLYNLEKDATGVSATDHNVTGQINIQKSPAAAQKSGRSQTIAQLNEYRRQQMEKFTANQSTPVISVDLDKEDTDWIDLTHTDRDIISHTPPKQNRITGPVANSQRDQLHLPLDGHMTQSDHSQYTASGHMSESSQSVKSDVTCGNCGEKGHTRKFKHCARYHSAEETARREEKAREDKKRRELRAVQEQLQKQINAQKDERKKQEIKNMQEIVMSAETEFQTTMNRLRNIIGKVENLSEPDLHNNRQNNSRKRKKKN